MRSVIRRRRVGRGGEGGGCIQEEAENLPDTTAMPEGAEYRREQRLERERGEAGGEGCCLAERSGGVGAPAWGGRGPKWGEGRRKERQKNSQRFKEEVRVSGKTDRMKKKDDERSREVDLVEIKRETAEKCITDEGTVRENHR